ncbi:ABC transporter ATP-binding protein [Sulfitobacter donghicola]|uniref:ATP-binding protein n=1 Tax=Sulfitobacter donghicola DSW-25 = KCTC 12864 = JCM 14565 TaxID=1300350 RepID=A0A073IDR4_9RHOB|nr:ABC transporter ATP-binding protein [Sulfitobacter donghicola]KEJ87720.1 ATP-binding protein [Sulfitobacter donghicola DSW-25 = KCTC 12864 = JCM 14565]KIN70413.1 ABC transporter related protein [Sulfitobacter donghicola DSW-25 = KCTC 12864 = JCM 14565]
MIELKNVHKAYTLNGVRKVIANDINFTFPAGETVALIGSNGAGKSTMLKMIAGSVASDRGEIIPHGSVSWPVGFAGSFHGDLTGAQNVKFVARIYGADTDEMCAFTREFSELGAHFEIPVRTYSSGMKSRLAFAMSMAVQFDTYLIDEITAVGDGAFKAKSEAILKERLKSSGAIIVSHSLAQLERMCSSGVVLQNGRFFYYARVEKAIEHYNHIMKGALPPWMR